MNNRVTAKAEGRNPFTRLCYICGREFGSKSLDIHEKQCIAKWDADNKLLPKEQRRARPRPPQLNAQDGQKVGGSATGMNAQQYNDAAFTTFMEESREPCPNCGRKFLRDRLEVHLRSCTPGGFFAKERQKRAEPTSSLQENTGAKLKDQPKARSHEKVDVIRSVPVKPPAKRPPTGVVPATALPVITSGLPTKNATVLPLLNAKALATDRGKTDSEKKAKFCGDCGHQFSLEAEKFCTECGVKRAIV